MYKAKRNAEVSEGVGKETDLGVLTRRGYYLLKDDVKDGEIRILSNIYNLELIGAEVIQT